jgi:hypothetical protein
MIFYYLYILHVLHCSTFNPFPTLWVWVLLMVRWIDTTLCDKVCQWLAAGQWFTPVSSTIKIDCHDRTEILLKVASNTTLPPPPFHTPYRFVIFLLIVHVLFLPILSIPNRQKMCTLWSLWMTFPLCKYFVAFNNWYMIYLLWTSFNIFPLFITLWRSVSTKYNV